jgi:16S rRNA (cytosine967-C5)-methyltransferase
VRLTATSILRQVIEHHVPLDSILDEATGNPHFRALDVRDRGLCRAIVGVALRRRSEIEAALADALDKPLPENSGALAAILHVAAAQILFLDVPDHAAVNLAVEQAAGSHRTGRARGLVNGVLRQLTRSSSTPQQPAGRLNTPPWLFQRWSAGYGEAIAEKNRRRPSRAASPRSLGQERRRALGRAARAENCFRPARSAFSERTASPTSLASTREPGGCRMPRRASGAMLGDVKGRGVADLCAAPGGKTAELAAAGAEVIAVDISPAGSDASRRTSAASALCTHGNRRHPEMAAGGKIRRCALDAPCSATGTIRRHPDIPWLKKPQDIATLAALQSRMLDRAADSSDPGDPRLLHLLAEPEEGEAQVAPFLERHSDYALASIEPSEIAGLGHLIAREGWLRTLPCHGFGDEPAMQGWTASSRPVSAAADSRSPRPGACLPRARTGLPAPHVSYRAVDQLRLALHRPAGSPGGCASARSPVRSDAESGGRRTFAARHCAADLRTADPTIAVEIYGGRFAFAGHVVEAAGKSPFDIGPPSQDWLRELHSFGWLRHLRAADTPLAPLQRRAIVEDWLTLHRRPAAKRFGTPTSLRAGRCRSWRSRRSSCTMPTTTSIATSCARCSATRGATRRHQLERAGTAAHARGHRRRADRLSLSQAGTPRPHRPRPDRCRAAGADPSDGGHISRNPAALVEILIDLLPLRQALIARWSRPVRDVDELHRPDDADAALLPARGRGLCTLQRGRRVGGSLVATVLSYDETLGSPAPSAVYSGYERIEGATRCYRSIPAAAADRLFERGACRHALLRVLARHAADHHQLRRPGLAPSSSAARRDA